MTVYVDRLTPCLETEEWPFRFHSRMHAYDIIELHNMARQLGLRREWYHEKSIPPYYDISVRKRQQAIEIGAILCTKEDTARICAEAKRKAAEEGTAGK